VQTVFCTAVIGRPDQVRTEACSTRPSQHTYRRPAQKIVTLDQTHPQLPQSTSDERGPRDATRASSLFTESVQELHGRLAQAPVCLHRDGDKLVAIRLQPCVGGPLLLVMVGGCCPRCRRRPVEEMSGESVHHGDIGDGDALGRTMRMSPRASKRVAEPSAALLEPVSRPGRRQSGGSRAEVISARCTAWRNIPFRMSWRSVSCTARERHRMAW
jgi:hypothetical protein